VECRATFSFSLNTRLNVTWTFRFLAMTEPHHALTVDGEDSGGNEVHEIYVRLEAGARTTTSARSKTRAGMLRRGGSDLGCPITNDPLKKRSFQRL